MGEAITDVYRAQPKKTKALYVDLPIPPSVNGMYFNTKHGGKRLTSKAQSYTRDARALLNLAVDEQDWTKPSSKMWLYVDMVFYFPDRRIRDSHNCLKLLMDVMQGIVFTNDYIALPRIQSVEYDKDHPRVELKVTPQTKSHREKGIKAVAVTV